LIDAHRNKETGGCRWRVEPICTELAVAPSTYYDAKSWPPSDRAVRDAELGPELKVKGTKISIRRLIRSNVRRCAASSHHGRKDVGVRSSFIR
jgi:hypothetical protein